MVESILNIPYVDGSCLAPTKDILDGYKSELISWADYEDKYIRLLKEREQEIVTESKNWGLEPVLICSEDTPDFCHRRLAAEYLLSLGLFSHVEHLISDR